MLRPGQRRRSRTASSLSVAVGLITPGAVRLTSGPPLNCDRTRHTQPSALWSGLCNRLEEAAGRQSALRLLHRHEAGVCRSFVCLVYGAVLLRKSESTRLLKGHPRVIRGLSGLEIASNDCYVIDAVGSISRRNLSISAWPAGGAAEWEWRLIEPGQRSLKKHTQDTHKTHTEKGHYKEDTEQRKKREGEMQTGRETHRS